MRNPVAEASPSQGDLEALEPTPSRMASPRRRVLNLIAESGLVGIAGGLIAALVAGWDPSRWRVYFSYEGDTLYNAMNGALANPLGVTDTTTRVGWPHGLSMVDFPAGEPIFTWFQWWAHRVVADDFTVLAAVWFLGFVLVAATTYLALRGLGFARWPAAVAALVYDFVPFHLWRGFGHTNLALYMAVPLAVMLLLWVMSGRLDRLPLSSPDRRPLWRTPDWWVAAACAFVIAVSARYYAVFFLMLLVLVSVGRAVLHQRARLLAGPAVIIGLTLGLSLLTGLPQVLQVAESGRNSEVAHRSRTESDLYGLRLTDLVAPTPGHRLEALADLSDTLRRTATRGEEGNSMGLFPLVGFLFLLAVAVLRRPRPWSVDRGVDDPVGLATNTAVVGALAFLLGTVGGLSGVIASLGFTQIRGWNRISIYISFAGAVGVAMALSWLCAVGRSPVRGRRWLPAVVLPLVLALAVLDQTVAAQPDQAAVAAERASDQLFFPSMADELGTGSSVFQLPYVPFPESGSAAVDYMGFRGFFNDGGRLNWSYGGMRGRQADWQRTWVTMDLEIQIVGITAAGFDAVLVDRVAYTPESNPEVALADLLGPARGESPDARFVWFDARPLHGRLVAEHGADWVAATGMRVVRPIGVQFEAGSYRFTGTGAQDWGTIGASTTIELRRYDDDTNPVDVQLGIAVAAGSEVVASDGSSRSAQVSTGPPVEFRHEASMASDTWSTRVTTNAPNLAQPTDWQPDVRGQIVELKVIDTTLARQIARGELRAPAP